MEVFVDDETKLTLHGLQQYYVKLKDSEKNRKLFDLLDVLEFNQVTVISSCFYSHLLWKWAHVNSNGLFGCNIGGDICQVSSTLCGSVSAAGGTEFSSHCDPQGNGSGRKVRHLLIPWYCNGWVRNANSEIISHSLPCRLSRYQQFKDFQRRILVATNLFGRGMDIERVNIVFNYDMPEDSDTYLHRVFMHHALWHSTVHQY